MRTHRRSPIDEPIWIILVVTAGAALRLWGIASLPWEEDELYTLRDASDLGAEAVAIGGPGIAARPLYYLLQHALLQVFPPTPVSLRAPAFLFGVAGLVATWWLARRIFGGYAGVLAALAAAVAPWHLYASQFARYWSLVYLLSALAIGSVFAVVDTPRRRVYLGTVAAVVLGALTHPTFLFPLAGVVLALHVINREGRILPAWPTREAVRWVWLPLLAVGVGGYAALKLFGRPQSLQEDTASGIAATLRLVPAMLQWIGPALVAAVAAALTLLWGVGTSQGRRWAAATALGTVGAFVLLLVASLKVAVYTDYGIATLPLLFAAIAGAMVTVADQFNEAARRWVLLAGAIVLVGCTGTETISHLSDGSRFDYRPAFDLIRQRGPEFPVVGQVDPVIGKDAPDLHYLPMHAAATGDLPSSFWMIISVRRWGLREGRAQLQQWIDRRCHRVGSFERTRFDYRLYRVEVHWCGSAPIPNGR